MRHTSASDDTKNSDDPKPGTIRDRAMSSPDMSQSELKTTVTDKYDLSRDDAPVLTIVCDQSKGTNHTYDASSKSTINTTNLPDTSAMSNGAGSKQDITPSTSKSRVDIHTKPPRVHITNDEPRDVPSVGFASSSMLLTGGSNLHNKSKSNDKSSANEMNGKNRAMGMKSKHTEGSTKPIYTPKTVKPSKTTTVKCSTGSRVISLTKTTVSSTAGTEGVTHYTSVTSPQQLICYSAPETIPTSGTQTLIIPTTPKQLLNKKDVFSSLATMKSLKVYTPSSPIKTITSKVPEHIVGTSSQSLASLPMSTAFTTINGAAGSNSTIQALNVRPSKSPHLCVQSVSHLHPLRGAVALQPRNKTGTNVNGTIAKTSSATSVSSTYTSTTVSGSTSDITTSDTNSTSSNGCSSTTATVGMRATTDTDKPNTPVPSPAHTGCSPPALLLTLGGVSGLVPPPAHTRVPSAGSSPPSNISPALPVDCSTSPPRIVEASNNNTSKLMSPHPMLDEQETPLDLHRPKVLSVS